MEPTVAQKRNTSMFIHKRLLLILILLPMLWWGTAVSQAQQPPDNGLTLAASAGYDGVYKSDFWVPVVITAANTGPAVEGELRIAVGSDTNGDRVVYAAPISLPTQSNKRVTMYVSLPRFTSEIQVVLQDANGRFLLSATSNKLNQLAVDGILYGVVTPTPGDLDFLQSVTASRPEAAVAYLSLDDLPDLSPAWNALDVLVLHDVDSSQLTPAQQTALTAWVETGGQLLVAGGPGWQKTAVPLADFLPVSLTGSESVADLPALSAAAGHPFRDPGPYFVTSSSLRRGEMLWRQDALPLLARQPQGLGAIYFLALDPSLAPLLDWNGSPVLWAEVANRLPPFSPWSVGIRNNYAANTAVGSLPSLALPSVLQLAFYLLVYVVVVGPVNYIVLKRRNRRELAWLTIPALVLLFSFVAYLTGFQIKGNTTIINEMSVAYGSADSPAMRVHSVLGLYSPRRGSYDVVLPAGAMARPLLTGFGEATNVGAIVRGSEVILRDVRVDVSDVESFAADSIQPALPITADAALQIADGRVELAATIRNHSQMTLQNVTLLMGGTAVALGDLAPGAEVNRLEVLGVASTVTGLPAFSFGPSFGSPLLMNAEIILGTSDYYNDRQAFPRWQLLQAMEQENSGVTTQVAPTVTLVAWTDGAYLDAALAVGENGRTATTLYLIEIPLAEQFSGGQVTVPSTLLNWEIVADNGLYARSIQNVYLPPGVWMEVVYRPWPELANLAVTALSVQLEPSASGSSPTPGIQLWDWSAGSWTTITDAAWGTTAVPNAQRFIGDNNAVQLRLENKSVGGLDLGAVYPVLVGELRP
ncbi:MAG: hypothetical protein IPM39_04735 [Chloroflexi bacterium]|nr:hypothetical protein [Chloroflexota bacterium]